MSLTLWLKKIGDKDMPAFRKTASEVSAAASNPGAGAEVLGKLILQDPALTARVLKVCNSAFYNSSGKSITTISRAVLILGVDTVRSLCVSLALVEVLLIGKRQDRVLADLGRSLHAAMQARAMAIAIKEPQAEEVFIAALLYRVGYMVFWCFSEEEGVALDAMLRPGQDDSLAEKAVLGFSLAQLTQALVDDWKLSPILFDIFRGRRHGGPAECVLKGWEFAKLVEMGWSDPAVRDYVGKMATRLKIDPVTVGVNLAKVAREAKIAAVQFGSPICASVIPVPDGPAEQDANLFTAYSVGETESTASFLTTAPTPGRMANPDVLLGCLRDLTKLATAGHLSVMFQVVLKGIQEGLGFDRAVFAAMVPGTEQVQGRTAVGLIPPANVESFKFTIRRQMADSMSRSMEQGLVIENLKDPTKRGAVVPDSLLNFVKGVPFLFSPVQLNGRVVGCYYCDCLNTGREISPSMVEGFTHLIQQMNALLTRAAVAKATASTP